MVVVRQFLFNTFSSLNVLTIEQTEFPFTYKSNILFTISLSKSFMTSSLLILLYPNGAFPEKCLPRT